MNNKGADQTARMRRLICTFVVRVWHKTHFLMAQLIFFNLNETYKMACAPSEDAAQPAHLHSLIRVITRCSMGSQGPKASLYWPQRPWSDCSDKQADPVCHTHIILQVLLCPGSYVNGKTIGRYTFSCNQCSCINCLIHQASQSLHVIAPLFLQQFKMFDGGLIIRIIEHNSGGSSDLWG